MVFVYPRCGDCSLITVDITNLSPMKKYTVSLDVKSSWDSIGDVNSTLFIALRYRLYSKVYNSR